MRKWQNVLTSGWKHCFVQTGALCWKSLRSCVPSAKMRKHADLGLKTLFCKNSGNLLKIANKWFVNRKKMTKRADVGLKTLFCTNSCTLLQLAKKWCTQWEVTCWCWAENAVCTNLRTLLKMAKKSCAQCGNDKTCWPWAQNAVLYKLVKFAENC